MDSMDEHRMMSRLNYLQQRAQRLLMHLKASGFDLSHETIRQLDVELILEPNWLHDQGEPDSPTWKGVENE